MRNHAFLKVVLLGLLTFALLPGVAGAGGGTDAIIDVSPPSLFYGTVSAGSCAGAAQFAISNFGTADLVVATVTTLDPFSVVGGFTNGTIPPGGTEFVDVDFCPSAGGYAAAELVIESNAVNGNPTFSVLLEGYGNTAPYFTSAFPNVDYPVFVTTSHSWDASDAEGDAVTWSIAGLPLVAPGLTVVDNGGGNSTATLEWTPSPVDVGTYSCIITVSDPLLSTDSPMFDVVVSNTNTPPTAEAGGPYVGVRTVPIDFDGTQSSDADGVILTYTWDYGDGDTGVGDTPSHAYMTIGDFVATLTVCDNGTPQLCASDQTNVSVVNFIPVELTAKLAANAIKSFGGGLQFIGAEPSPVTGVSALDINPASLRLSIEGHAGEIAPGGGKSATVGDLDSDFLNELVVSFTRDQIAALTAGLSSGSYTWVITGTTVPAKGSVPVRGTHVYDLKTNGSGAVSSFAAPNPFNPETSISYTLRNQGVVSVRIYSVNGQLVRSLREEFANPGTHEVRWNGTDDSGRPVRSGIYFVNVVQGADKSNTKVVVAK